MLGMDMVLRYRGRAVGAAEVALIRQLIAAHPEASRRALSLRLCAAWGWKQANGAPRDGVCRSLLLALHRAGHLTLPPARHLSPDPAARRTPAAIAVAADPLVGSLGALGPVEISQARRTPEEALVNALIEQHHVLGYAPPVGEHLKFLVQAQGRPIACFAW